MDPGYLQTFPVSGEHNVNYDGVKPLTGFDFGNRIALDFGDAPGTYKTLLAERWSPCGLLEGLSLGNLTDIENDAIVSSDARGDDVRGVADSTGNVIDDEEGITFVRPIVSGDSKIWFVLSSANATGQSAFLHAWVDFNQDGDFDDQGEQIITNRLVQAGNNDIELLPPLVLELEIPLHASDYLKNSIRSRSADR